MFLYGNLTFDILCSDLLMLAIRQHVTKWELYLISILVLNLVVWDHVIFFWDSNQYFIFDRGHWSHVILCGFIQCHRYSFSGLFKRSIVEFIQ